MQVASPVVAVIVGMLDEVFFQIVFRCTNMQTQCSAVHLIFPADVTSNAMVIAQVVDSIKIVCYSQTPRPRRRRGCSLCSLVCMTIMGINV